MVVEIVTASEFSGDPANVDDVVPAVMSDTVVSVAERRYINIITMVLLQPSAINEIKNIFFYKDVVMFLFLHLLWFIRVA